MKNYGMQMDEMIKRIGLRVRAQRRSKNISQSTLSQMSKLSRAAVIHIETHKAVPSLESLINIASALDVHLSYFFVDEPGEGQILQPKQEQSAPLQPNDLPMAANQ
jgi:transcriptional regulator with XRE-family HTH domain